MSSARSRLALALLPAAVTLIVIALAVSSSRTLVQATFWVDHTRQVLAQANVLMLQVSGAESGQRGYLVTGDTTFLTPEHGARVRAERALAELRRLTADNLQQGPRLDTVARELSMRFAVLDTGIALRRAGKLDVLLRSGLLVEGRAHMNRLREMDEAVMREEQRLLAVRQGIAGRQVRTMTVILLVGGALAVIIAALVNLLLTRILTERERMSSELGAQLGDLISVRRALEERRSATGP